MTEQTTKAKTNGKLNKQVTEDTQNAFVHCDGNFLVFFNHLDKIYQISSEQRGDDDLRRLLFNIGYGLYHESATEDDLTSIWGVFEENDVFIRRTAKRNPLVLKALHKGAEWAAAKGVTKKPFIGKPIPDQPSQQTSEPTPSTEKKQTPVVIKKTFSEKKELKKINIDLDKLDDKVVQDIFLNRVSKQAAEKQLALAKAHQILKRIGDDVDIVGVLENMYIVNGTLSIRSNLHQAIAELALLKFNTKQVFFSGLCTENVYDKDGKISAVIAHIDKSELLPTGKYKETKLSYTATLLELTKGNTAWSGYPTLMLTYRARTYLIRTVNPLLTFNLYGNHEFSNENGDVVFINDDSQQKETK
ncbi:MAG: hypothetical protein OXB93_01170 [Cytophagales bacterium]|nr:hypothetical protein [Cytophagales bacterium]